MEVMKFHCSTQTLLDEYTNCITMFDTVNNVKNRIIPDFKELPKSILLNISNHLELYNYKILREKDKESYSDNEVSSWYFNSIYN